MERKEAPKLGSHPRELNKYFRDGGTGLPEEARIAAAPQQVHHMQHITWVGLYNFDGCYTCVCVGCTCVCVGCVFVGYFCVLILFYFFNLVTLFVTRRRQVLDGDQRPWMLQGMLFLLFHVFAWLLE